MAGKRISYHRLNAQHMQERLKALQLELPQLCTDFFRSISQTTSALTRLAYAYDLRLFFRYLHEEHVSFANSIPKLYGPEEMRMVTPRDIAGFQEYLQQYVSHGAPDEGGDASPLLVQNHELGIMRKLSCVRSFFDYLFKNDIVPANVATKITLPKRPQKPILYLDPQEVQRLMDTVLSGDGLSDRQKKLLDITRKRDVAILMLFLGTGIRVSELVGLDMDDLDIRSNAFVVTRKGGNQTILYYPDPVRTLSKSTWRNAKRWSRWKDTNTRCSSPCKSGASPTGRWRTWSRNTPPSRRPSNASARISCTFLWHQPLSGNRRHLPGQRIPGPC